MYPLPVLSDRGYFVSITNLGREPQVSVIASCQAHSFAGVMLLDHGYFACEREEGFDSPPAQKAA